jgi:DNA-binding NtrC family response regulator
MTVGEKSRGPFRSVALQAALDAIRVAIASPGCVLVRGEAGTGRETVARVIHLATHGDGRSPEELLHEYAVSFDSAAPFVVVDCARVKSDIEVLIFGDCKPSSRNDSLEIVSTHGLLYRCRGGSLFLRDVNNIPGRIQNRLARVLRDGEVWLDDGPASRLIPVEARILASVDTSDTGVGDLLAPELRNRLATHRIDLPPLRQRREDLPGLVRLLVANICTLHRLPATSVSSQAVSLLSALPWRGNLGELRTLLRTLVVNGAGRMIRVADVLTHVRLDGDVTFSTGGTLKEARERFERDYVMAVLRQHHGRMSRAARVLGMQRTNLYRKVRQLALVNHIGSLATSESSASKQSRRRSAVKEGARATSASNLSDRTVDREKDLVDIQ